MPLIQAKTPVLDVSRPQKTGLTALLQVLAVWSFRRRSRQSLGRLGPQQLRDIGLDPISAGTEVVKPFWKD